MPSDRPPSLSSGVTSLVAIARNGGASEEACAILEQTLVPYVAAVRRETIEKCARACEALDAIWKPTDPGNLESVSSMEHIKHGAWECARAIRALPSEGATGEAVTCTVSSKHQWPIRCAFCEEEVGDHIVKESGNVYCSQLCARSDNDAPTPQAGEESKK